MRRSLPAIAGTALGLFGILSYKTSPAPTAAGAATNASSRPSSSSTTTAKATTTTTTAASSRTTARSSTSTAPPTTAAAVAKRVDGPVVMNKFGPVQVEVTVRGSTIVDVQALQLPTAHQRSAEISNIAAPALRREVLAANGTNIDGVSGATYTSDSYVQSLQAALDQARR